MSGPTLGLGLVPISHNIAPIMQDDITMTGTYYYDARGKVSYVVDKQGQVFKPCFDADGDITGWYVP